MGRRDARGDPPVAGAGNRKAKLFADIAVKAGIQPQ